MPTEINKKTVPNPRNEDAMNEMSNSLSKLRLDFVTSSVKNQAMKKTPIVNVNSARCGHSDVGINGS